jgi:predicted Ser/Thr protein kinase
MSAAIQILKRDALGRILLCSEGQRCWIRREIGGVRPWLRPIARHAMRRELRALWHLAGVPGVPTVLTCERDALDRSLLPGVSLAASAPTGAWFRHARLLLRALHRRGIAHNDLAKPENWLVLADGTAGVIDFQLAVLGPPRARWLRLMAREDLRHLLKHKRTFRPDELSPTELRLLARRSWAARTWRHLVKRLYNLLTRRVLRWSDREGRGLPAHRPAHRRAQRPGRGDRR